MFFFSRVSCRAAQRSARQKSVRTTTTTTRLRTHSALVHTTANVSDSRTVEHGTPCVGARRREFRPHFGYWTRPRNSFLAHHGVRCRSTTADEYYETIFALSSGPGRCAVSIVRATGPKVPQLLELLCGFPLDRLPSPRYLHRTRLVYPTTGETLDDGMVVWFEAPNSVTGEHVLEFHVHGSAAVVSGLLDALAKVDGCRGADAGEFTRRAMLNNKLTLTQVEGLSDLLAAETSAQRRQALGQLDGHLQRLYEQWRSAATHCLALTEAGIDFVDESDVSDDILLTVRPLVDGLRRTLVRHLRDGHMGERLRSGVSVAIVGPPNAGKSTLLNLLARRKAAIVTSVPGTTRDVIEVSLDIAGYPVILADTAGIREAADEIEAEGVRLAHERFESSDLRILVLDCSSLRDEQLCEWSSIAQQSSGVLLNKVDTVHGESEVQELVDFAARELNLSRDRLVVASCAENINVDDVLVRLGRMVTRFFTRHSRNHRNAGANDAADGSPDECTYAVHSNQSDQTSQPVLTRARHREHLERCVTELESYLDGTKDQSLPAELAAEHLRRAAQELGRLTGRIHVDDVLDVVFRDFCIGK